MDVSKIYEGYVQHIMGLVASSKNARIFNNLKLNTSGDRTSWWLPYIEPDIVLVKDNLYISIDAKYKMHMMNVKSESVESLHESFRSDLHQVLAYSSFGITKNKMSMLIYPAKRFICKHQIITNTFFSVNNHIYLIGIPFGECRKEDDSDELMDLSEKIRIAADGLSYIIESIFMNKIIE